MEQTEAAVFARQQEAELIRCTWSQAEGRLAEGAGRDMVCSRQGPGCQNKEEQAFFLLSLRSTHGRFDARADTLAVQIQDRIQAQTGTIT